MDLLVVSSMETLHWKVNLPAATKYMRSLWLNMSQNYLHFSLFHIINLPFYQLAVSSISHFVNLLFLIGTIKFLTKFCECEFKILHTDQLVIYSGVRPVH
jgi:hypothetical protein